MIKNQTATERSDWKGPSITLSASPLIMISCYHGIILSFFERIKRSSSVSLEDTMLIAIIKWIFYVSDFLRLFISFKYVVLSFSSLKQFILIYLTCLKTKVCFNSLERVQRYHL